MKYTQEQFEEICGPLSTDLNIDFSLGPADSYDLQSLSRLCANRITTNLDWSILGARLHLKLIRETAGKTFSESTNKLGLYLDKDYFNYIIEHKDELNKIPKEENSENRHAIAVGVVDKSYLLKYNKCGNCKQDCPECETFYVGETFEQMYMRIATFVCRPLSNNDKTGDIEMIKQAYQYLSDNVFSCATPTMYNAGTSRPQCASCFVKTIEDSLHSIEDNWMYTGEISRNSGGIGTDVSKIRHSQIGNAGKSDGVPALLKPYESILVYVDQSKKRKGSAAFYLATWHVDIEEFIMMKVPVGNQASGHARNKCEDLFYSAWIPDIFMERARDDKDWTLFCPKRCPGLTEVYGKELEDLYIRYEKEGKGIKTVKARSILHLLFEAQCKKGVPYMCFSDRFNECNIQKNIGIIRSSNLCSEISLHTSENEIASCNLASLCLSKFVDDKTREFNYSYLGEVTRFVIRFMNNIIDRNYYPERIPQIKYANLKNRPLGIGIQGLANTFAKMELLFDSEEAREVNDKIIQTIYYYAVDESANLAQQFGSYPAFEGSPYSKGLLHPDIWRAPNGDRSEFLDCYDWSSLRIKASKGMRNSTLLALMPTATSSIIAEQSPCFEPFNFIVGSKSLISGQYTVVCKEFVEDMQKLGVWNDDFAKQIYFDPDNNIGSIQNIKIPDSIKDSPLKVARWNFLMDKYRTAYEIGARESIKQALQRTPFVCQSQSTNWFVGKPSFNKWFKNVIGSWERGAKTCMYYMRGNSSMKARAAMACEGCTG